MTWTADDVVVLAVKSQDTEPAARALVAAAGPDVPVVAAQNGVANERTLARWFGHVHGLCVMMPTEHLEPGVVIAHSAAATGILDLGRFPAGTDDVDDALAAALRASRCESVARPDIMRWKYRKLAQQPRQRRRGAVRRTSSTTRTRGPRSTCSRARPSAPSRPRVSTR